MRVVVFSFYWRVAVGVHQRIILADKKMGMRIARSQFQGCEALFPMPISKRRGA